MNRCSWGSGGLIAIRRAIFFHENVCTQSIVMKKSKGHVPLLFYFVCSTQYVELCPVRLLWRCPGTVPCGVMSWPCVFRLFMYVMIEYWL